MLSFVIGMNDAELALLSQQQGRRDDEGLRRHLDVLIVILFTGALALDSRSFLAANTLLGLMRTPSEIFSEARDYLQITLLGMVVLFGYNLPSTVREALGESRTPMRFVTFGAIHTLALGIRGRRHVGLLRAYDPH